MSTPQVPATSNNTSTFAPEPIGSFGNVVPFHADPQRADAIARQREANSIKKKAPSSKGWGSRICRRSPNLPHTYACSTIGPTRLNFRVRDGNGCDPRGKLTGKILKSRSRDLPQLNRLGLDVFTSRYNYRACIECAQNSGLSHCAE
jgi:hypothetical protein